MTRKILIAEDNETVQAVLKFSIKMFCHDIESLTATTREEAISIIASTDDLAFVVTDLRMPNFGDGETVAEAAQQKGISVIVFSTSLGDLSEIVRNNCLAVLSKENDSVMDITTLINDSLQS